MDSAYSGDRPSGGGPPIRVSVVITSFNYGRYLTTCLDSVLAQTFRDFEVIVVDDGSTDETAEVAQRFLHDTRVRYHYQENQGQTVAKNVGIRLSRGELVAFLDADDCWQPDKLAKQVPLFENPRVGVTFTGFGFIDTSDRPVPFDGPEGYFQLRRGRVTRWLGFENFVPFSSSMVRRSLLESEGAFDERLRMGIDWEIWLRLSRVTDFDFVPQRLIAYRVGHANQMSKNWEGRINAADLIFQRFVAEYPDAFSREDLRHIEAYNACARAAVYRERDLKRSTALLLKAVRLTPLSRDPYVGFIRNAQVVMRRLVAGSGEMTTP